MKAKMLLEKARDDWKAVGVVRQGNIDRLEAEVTRLKGFEGRAGLVWEAEQKLARYKQYLREKIPGHTGEI